jgi:hypothetical protein
MDPVTAAVATTVCTKLGEGLASAARAALLEEEVATSKAAEDPDILAAVETLKQALAEAGHAVPAGVNVTVRDQATMQGIAGAGSVRVDSMTFGDPPKR